MTIRRRRLLFIAFVGLVLAAGLWVWAVSTSLSTKDAKRVVVGMTRSQALAAIGRPPDMKLPRNRIVPLTDIWEVVDGMIIVQYDSDELVDSVDPRDVGILSFTWYRIRRKLGLFN